MYFNVLLIPLLSFLIIFFFGFYIGRLGAAYISVFSLLLTFFCSVYIFFEIVLKQVITSIKLYNFISVDIYSVQIGFIFDPLSSVMLIVITFISFIVHLYSITYLSEDPYLARFMSYLSLFTFFMILLVTSDNYVQLFVGWEGVGLCSYLLINFWFTRLLANKAALTAMIMNRIADVFFLLAIIFIMLKFKTTDFNIVFNMIPFYIEDVHYFLFQSYNSLEIISFFLFIGAIGKSAQFGFHTWLPVAMEGPTPVSALLHAATMVTAGVFLIIRSSFFIEFSENVLNLLIFFGSITTFFAGLVAIYQYDIKKIIAYSTCSQLGYMFIASGLSNYQLAMFHLFNHAFFKALLFLSAGVVIHAFFGEQDIRKFGGNVIVFLPFTYICFVIGSLAIMGFPYLTGFFSKEVIIELGFNTYIIDMYFSYVISLISAIFTAIYSFKLLINTFIVRSINGFKTNYKFFNKIIVDAYSTMLLALVILSIMSIFIAYFFKDLFIGTGTPIWNNYILILSYHENLLKYEFLPFLLKYLPLWFCILSIFIYITYFFIDNDEAIEYSFLLKKITYWFNLFFINNYYLSFQNLVYNAFFFNKIYNTIFIKTYIYIYKINVKYIDKGFFEFFGPFGLYIIKKYILSENKYFFFKNIYFSLFIKYFLFLNLIYICYFYSLFTINLIFIIILYIIIDGYRETTVSNIVSQEI
jgi:proton-translocating NADH-quinone oxidoreductase chain L